MFKNKNHKKLFFLLCMILLTCVCKSQSYNIQNIDIREGLSNNNITDITYDKQGLLWIATESGLNRFDGKQFRTFLSNNSSIVSNELNTLLYDDKSNKLWIGSQRDGISVLDCETLEFENYTTKNFLATNDVTHLSFSADSSGIWITHYHIGLEYYDLKTKKYTLWGVEQIKGLKPRNWCSFDDGNGKLYIGHDYNGMSIIDMKTKMVENYLNGKYNPLSLPGNNVRSIFQDSKKNVWVGTDQGLALFNPINNTFTSFRHDTANKSSIGSDFIYSITEINEELLIATEMSGISVLNLKNFKLGDPQTYLFENIKSVKDNGILTSANVRCITKDLFNNIWIGLYHQGIDFLSNMPPIFNTFGIVDDKQKSENEIWSIALNSNENIWVGSQNEINLFKDYTLNKTIDLKQFISNNNNPYVNILKFDSIGYLWIGTTNTDVLKYDISRNTAITIHLPTGYGYIQNFLIEDDIVWIATDNGLFSYRNNKLFEEKEINNQLADRTIYNIVRDQKDRLWIGTFGRGIFVFDKTNKLIGKFEKENGFCSNAINDIFIDSQDRIWIATRNGLACFSDQDDLEKIELYDEKQGMSNSYIRAIQEDILGNIWLSTNSGISFFQEKDNQFINYNYQDGVPSGNFINSASFINKEGFIFFASNKEVCYFDPNFLLRPNESILNVEIIQCSILNSDNSSYNAQLLQKSDMEKINLSYNQNSIQISFSVTDFAKEKFVEYAYEMEGLDNTWHSINENNLIFRNLAHGNYTFKIKAKLKDQKWENAISTQLYFAISPPFWLTWYAKSFYFIIVGVIFVFFLCYYRKRTNFKLMLEIERRENLHKEELNNERLSFYTNITHELRTPLTLILGPLEDLKHEKELSKQQHIKINTIYGSALRLLDLVNQLLEFRKTETQNRRLMVSKGNISNQIKEIALKYKNLNTNKNLHLEINIEKNVFIYYDADMIASIVNNLLGNAIKYTPQGQINLELYSTDLYTEIIIGDTGYGIEEDKLPFIFERYYQIQGKHQASGTGIGLALVKSLVALHDATLDVASTIGEGTTFKLKLLTNNTYPRAIHLDDVLTDKLLQEDLDIIDTLDKKSILIVEDDNDIKSYIIDSLKFDFNILSATNGNDGLNITKKYPVDLIVSDVMMPIMDGFEFAKILKQDINTSHIPIILLTAKDSLQDRELGYEIGVDSYITKPFSVSLLKSRIINILKGRERLVEQLIPKKEKEKQTEGNEKEPEIIKLSKLDKVFLEKLTKLIEEHLDMDSLDMTFIKENMNMSYSSFYRKVKSLTNFTPNEFVRKLKLKKSVELLDQNIYSISEIAYMSGFNDVVYFRKCFKEEFQVTPSEYSKKTLD